MVWSNETMSATFNRNGAAGFSLLEVIVATGLIAGALMTLGQMLSVSITNNQAARRLTYATVLAEQKMEQLRGLSWGFDSAGLPLSDTNTNTAAPIESPTGGSGLSVSPAGTLTRNTDGWVDYVDRFGNVLGGGSSSLPKTAYIRRWAIEPLAANPDNAIVIHVLVTARHDRGAADAPGSSMLWPDEAGLVSVKTRKAP
jgi:type II secretory pathway pseudopilin PulG